jgi:ABC-type oligopeptide transport system substrate-binding subunit
VRGVCVQCRISDHAYGWIKIRKFIVPELKRRIMRYLLIILVLVTVLLAAGCVSKPQETGVITRITTTLPASTPAPTIIQTPSNQDPIVGSWQNGLIFYANGTVGSDGTTSWKVNKDEKNSYFITSDKPSELDKGRDITSAEWVYNPVSDSIHKRGSLISVYRR